VAVWLLGVGTLKDLALVQLVGIIVGTYSSIFFATPLLVTLRERTELVRAHTRRVLKRRKPDAPAPEDTDTADDDEVDDASDTEKTTRKTEKATPSSAEPAANKPAPGARPVRPTGTRRPSGKRNAGRR
jgi:preprotein translocase subunit SecF